MLSEPVATLFALIIVVLGFRVSRIFTRIERSNPVPIPKSVRDIVALELMGSGGMLMVIVMLFSDAKADAQLLIFLIIWTAASAVSMVSALAFLDGRWKMGRLWVVFQFAKCVNPIYTLTIPFSLLILLYLLCNKEIRAYRDACQKWDLQNHPSNARDFSPSQSAEARDEST